MFWGWILEEFPSWILGKENPKFFPREGQVRLILVARNWWKKPKFHQGGAREVPREVWSRHPGGDQGGERPQVGLSDLELFPNPSNSGILHILEVKKVGKKRCQISLPPTGVTRGCHHILVAILGRFCHFCSSRK